MDAATGGERRGALSGLQARLIEQTIELTHIAEDALGEETTSNTAIRVLLATHAAPGMTPSALATRLGVSRSAVSRALRDLQTAAVVTRTPDERDRRVMRLTLTLQGAERVTSFQQRLVDHFRATTGAVRPGCRALGATDASPAEHPVTPLAALDVLARAGAAAAVDATAAAADFGISSPTGRFAVSLVAEHGALQPTQLASMLRLTSGGISQVIDRLEARRLVVRDAGTQDRRAVVVTLTDAGERAAAAILDSFERHAAALCSAMALASRAQLASNVA